MKYIKFIFLIPFVLFTAKTFAANIAIIDVGMPQSFLDQIAPYVIHVECISRADDFKRVRPIDNPANPPGWIYQYRYHSLSSCENATKISQTRRVMTDDFVDNRGDRYLTLSAGNHMAHVSHVANALRDTGTRIILIHAGAYYAGFRNGEKAYLSAGNLEHSMGEFLFQEALRWAQILDSHKYYFQR